MASSDAVGLSRGIPRGPGGRTASREREQKEHSVAEDRPHEGHRSGDRRRDRPSGASDRGRGRSGSPRWGRDESRSDGRRGSAGAGRGSFDRRRGSGRFEDRGDRPQQDRRDERFGQDRRRDDGPRQDRDRQDRPRQDRDRRGPASRLGGEFRGGSRPQSWQDRALAEIGGTTTDDVAERSPMSVMISEATQGYTAALPMPRTLTDDQWRSLTMPVRLDIGGESALAGGPGAAERVTRLVSQAEVTVWPGGTHSLPMDEADALGRELLDFWDASEGR